MPTVPCVISGNISWEVAPPVQPPGIWPSPGVPTHPIVIPPPVHPPGIRPSPGVPTPPIYYPPTPSHPIVLPPPGQPQPPEGAHPMPPIYYPPPPSSPAVPEFPIGGEGWQLRYVPGYGWILVPPANWVPPAAGSPPPGGSPPTVTPHTP